MLTGKMIRVRYARDQIIPSYLDADDPIWLEFSERLLEIFRSSSNRTRFDLEEEIKDNFGNAPDQQIHQGLAKLLEDRCEFAVVSGVPPEKVREIVFQRAAEYRESGIGNRESVPDSRLSTPDSRLPIPDSRFDRMAVIRQAAAALSISTEEVERSLFADLRSEQQITKFKDITAERLLQRYNVALAQSVLLRATTVQVTIRGEPPRRYRQLMRLIKFHRLMGEFEKQTGDAYLLKLDGPLSLFSSTQKYGLQLALFLPAILLCENYELEAELLWGPQRKPKRFHLTSKDGLNSHYADTGMYVPPELDMFVELFRSKVDDWEIKEETELLPLGKSLWAPDYQLLHKSSKKIVYLEILGFWRRSSVESHLQRLRDHAPAPFVLAIADQLRVDEGDLVGLESAVYRFRQMPLPKEVAKAAKRALEAGE